MSFSKAKANLTAVLVSYPGTTGQRDDPHPRLASTRRIRHDPAVTEPIVAGHVYRTFDFDLQPKDSSSRRAVGSGS